MRLTLHEETALSRGGAWPSTVSGPLGGASVWSINANGPGGPFSPFILDLSRAAGTPITLALTLAPAPYLVEDTEG
jgi:hypothetical protein